MTNKLREIMDNQEQLLYKFAPNYEANGFGFLIPSTDQKNDDSHSFQYRLHDRYANVQREMGELVLAIDKGTNIEEEFSDVIHFLAEFSVLSRTDIFNRYPEMVEIAAGMVKTDEEFIWMFNLYSGIMMDTIKNKPWKKTPVETPWKSFEENLVITWAILIAWMDTHGFEDISSVYNYKARINEERIKAGR